MFNSLIDETARKFDLGDKAGTLLSALLALITDRRKGSFDGFLNRFREAGLGDTARSWVNSGANTPLSYEQLESALGEDALRDIADHVGIEYEKTVFASAFMIPHIVDQLSPEGSVPPDHDLLTRIGKYLTEPDESAPTPAEMNIPGTSHTETAAAGDIGEGSVLNLLLPLLMLVFLIAIGYTFCGGRAEQRVAPVSNVNSITGNASR